MRTIFESTGGQYKQQGDYSLPSLQIEDTGEYHIGAWGRQYRKHLKEHHRILYCNYLTNGTLNQHIAEVDKQATELFERLIKELAEKENVTEQLKGEAPMEWVRRVNNIRSRAREIVLHDVISD